jgi:chromosome segregation ATPase
MGLFTKNKQIIIDAQERIEAAKGRIDEAFLTFSMLKNEIETANEEIMVAQIELENEVKALQAKMDDKKRLIESAQANIEANKALASKLDDFIPRG